MILCKGKRSRGDATVRTLKLETRSGGSETSSDVHPAKFHGSRRYPKLRGRVLVISGT